MVNTFGSVSMLMETAHASVLTVFRSVAGLIQQLRRLRHNWSAIFSAVSLAKSIRWIKSLLMSAAGADQESTWEQLERANHQRVWSIQAGVMGALILGVPYMAWKLMSTTDDGDTEM